MDANVGELRAQAAYTDSQTPVIVITDDEELRKLLGGRKLVVAEFYPDTTDGDGHFNRSFKVKVRIQE